MFRASIGDHGKDMVCRSGGPIGRHLSAFLSDTFYGTWRIALNYNRTLSE